MTAEQTAEGVKPDRKPARKSIEVTPEVIACGDCRWWDRETPNDTADDAPPSPFGDCRRHAPRPGQIGAWPTTHVADWCGEAVAE